MLRLLFCVLVLALLVPAPVSAQGNGAQVAGPENHERAIAMLGRAEGALPASRPSDRLRPLVSSLFNAQSSCQKAAFDKAKADLLEQLRLDIRSVAAEGADRGWGGSSALPWLTQFRDLIASLQYRDCPKPNRRQMADLARQRHAMSAFRAFFGVIQLRGRTSGYVWLRGGPIGGLFENLVFYQRICDRDTFERLRAQVRSEIEERLGKDTSPTKEEALRVLDKIIYVPCGKPKPKPQTATAGPQSGGEPDGSRTSGGTGQDTTPTPNVTPTPAVTPGSQDQTPDEEPLPGLDDPPEDAQQETDKDVSFETDESSYTIAVQVPELCLGTLYTITEGTTVQVAAREVPVVTTEQEEDRVIWTDISTEEEDDGAIVTDVPVVTGSGDQPSDEPAEDVPVVSVPEDGDKTQETPQVEVPVASVPENEPEDEEIDLGLVKAQENIVELALTRKSDGQPVTEAVVKSLGAEPPLPGGPDEFETAFDADAFFEDDVSGGVSGDDGSVQISFAASAAATPVDDGGNETPLDEQPGQATTLTVSIDDEPREQLVVALNGVTPAEETVSVATSGPNLSRYVTNAFMIGTQPIMVLSVPLADMPALKNRIETAQIVSWFEPNPCRNKEDEIDDPYFNEAGLWGQDFDDQWAIKRAGFSGKLIAEALERNGTKPIVAVIDTGLDWFHPDLNQDSIWRNNGEIPGNGLDDDGNGYTDDTIGWNFINQNNRPWDHDGHGTFVAGVIAAATNNAVGIAGVSPHARIMPLKALDTFGRGHASTIAEAIAYAADNGARVINLSLGGRGLTRVEQLAVEHATASGALVIVAAGNTAADVAEYGPAGLNGVITVSATDRRDRQAGFSNWGEEIDISAPGVDVLSLRARKTDLLSYIPGVEYEMGAGIVGEDRAYFRASGTSFAAPIVTGAAALIMAQRPDVEASAVQRMLLNAAKDIETPGIDNYTGYGLLDVQAALAADPAFSVESRIERVETIKVEGKPALRLIGTADASEFESASLALGPGKDPKTWRRIKRRIEEPVRGDVLMDFPAGAFQGAKSWTIRLITRHKNGEEREARFSVTLG